MPLTPLPWVGDDGGLLQVGVAFKKAFRTYLLLPGTGILFNATYYTATRSIQEISPKQQLHCCCCSATATAAAVLLVVRTWDILAVLIVLHMLPVPGFNRARKGCKRLMMQVLRTYCARAATQVAAACCGSSFSWACAQRGTQQGVAPTTNDSLSSQYHNPLSPRHPSPPPILLYLQPRTETSTPP